MILQALNNYYERLAADPEADISPYGFGMQGCSSA
jgi:CRISPR-associated protein Csd1